MSGSIRVRDTSAMPRALRSRVPAKMTSSILPPRRDLADCSPKTQAIASEIFDLPQPLGPTIAARPSPWNLSSVRSQKDLNPRICNFFSLSNLGSLDSGPCESIGGWGADGYLSDTLPPNSIILASLGPGWEEKREFNVKRKGRRVKQQTPQIVATFPQPRHLAHQTQQSTRKGRRQGEIARASLSLIHENSACNRGAARRKNSKKRPTP